MNSRAERSQQDRVATLAEWSADGVKSALKTTGTQLGVKGRELFQPVRAALTGRNHGPELPLLAEALGRDRCIARLRAASSSNGTPNHTEVNA